MIKHKQVSILMIRKHILGEYLKGKVTWVFQHFDGVKSSMGNKTSGRGLIDGVFNG